MAGTNRVHNSVKYLRLIIVFLCLTGLSWAVGPTVVQSSPSTCFSNNTTTVTCSMGSAITGGNSIWIFQGEGSAGATISAPTMTGETFTKVTGASLVDSGLGQVALYVAVPAAGGQTSFTCHSSAAEDIHCHAIEVSGQSASPVDCSNTAASTTGSLSCSATSANDLVLAFFFDNGNNKTLTVGTGYTKAQGTNNTTGGDSAISEWQLFSATGSHIAAAGGNATDRLQQSIVAISPATAGATVRHRA